MKKLTSAEKIHDIILYIEQHLYDKIDLTSLQMLFYTSAPKLYRAFYAFTGHSVVEYIRRRRLSNALALLKSSSMTIAEIAAHCGYSSQQSFNRYVRKTTGETPAQYRSSDRYYIFPPAAETPTYAVSVEKHTIALHHHLQYTSSSPAELEHKAVAAFRAANPEYCGRLFGYNGQQKGASFPYYLLTDTDCRSDPSLMIRQPYWVDGIYATVTVPNTDTAVTNAWNYLYYNWLTRSMYTSADAPFLEEYLSGRHAKDDRLRLYLPLTRRDTINCIRLCRQEDMLFLCAAEKGPDAETAASHKLMRHAAAAYPYIVKSSRCYLIQYGKNTCTAGIHVSASDDIGCSDAAVMVIPSGLYAVLRGDAHADCKFLSDLLLQWIADNGMTTDGIPFTLYQTDDTGNISAAEIRCRVKLL